MKASIFRSYIYTLLLLLSFIANSMEDAHRIEKNNKHIHGIHQECSLPKSTNDIINCSLDFHPSVKRGQLNLESASSLKERASQRPNPTLSARYVQGSSQNDVSELETSLLFTLELGQKRKFRKDYALAGEEQAIVSNEAIKSEVKIYTVLNLYRLRQVLDEKKVIQEALRAFSKVINALNNLPRLSAEQEASLTLLEIAFEETRINQAEIYEEERKLEHYFHISTGHSLAEIKPYLPTYPKVWPTIKTDKSDIPSPEIRKLNSLSNLAQKEIDIQRSQAWPDLKIGPAFTIERDGSNKNNMLGLSLQIPLPIFQTNRGGRAYARNEYTRIQKDIELTQAEESHERFEQLKIYESAVKILKYTMKQSRINKKHSRVESLYLRGVVSNSVFLDSLKQKLSYLKSRNHRELTAIKALWYIHKYDGKALKETL